MRASRTHERANINPKWPISAVPVERVRLAKEQVAGEETVSGEVRKEQIETDTDGDTGTLR